MTLSKLAVRRLTKLADYMDALPKEAKNHFDMANWLGHEGDHNHGFGKFIAQEDPMTCGTTACALGFAATVPSFRKAGLRVAIGSGFNENVTNKNFRSAQKFFDCSENAAHHLFGYSMFIQTPKQWAKHCRKFILENS